MEHLVNPEQAHEYLRNLQDQVDHLAAREVTLKARIEKLEGDRELLRQRLQNARASRLRRLLNRIVQRLSRRGSDKVEKADTETDPAPSPAVNVPGVGSIPHVDLPRRSPALDVRVAVILDEFSRASFGYEFDCVDVRPGSTSDVTAAQSVDLVFVESAYRGVDGAWTGQVARFGEPSAELRRFVEGARERGIPTVFWNKEDPINADWFLGAASLFDWVFTVDADMIPVYRERLGHDRVGVLPFAAQPVIHHPPPPGQTRPGRVAFAGSYYAAKHPERRAQMDMLLDPAREAGLCIFDRHAGHDDRFAWPERFRNHVVGSLSYAQTLEAYRRFQVFLNVNTVANSPTMCARRIFELAGCGTPVLSGPARAIDEMMPPGAIRVALAAEGAREALQELLADPVVWRAQADAARDWVLSEHTTSHRVRHMLKVLGVW